MKRICIVGIAQATYRLGQRVQHLLQIERRAADHLQHIGGCSLLLERFAQILGARLDFFEQSHIHDCDDGLRSEILQ